MGESKTGGATSPKPADVVIANPGAIAEMGHLAAGVARSGRLRAYVVPIGGGPELEARVAGLPGRLGPRAAAELRRRRIPSDIPLERVVHRGVGAELGYVAAQRAKLRRSITGPVVRARNRAFDRALARVVRPGDAAVVATYGSALETLRRARDLGVKGWLEYPIAHHAFAMRELAEEARREPAWAPTLQFHEFSDEEQQRLNTEIEVAHRVLVLSSAQRATFAAAGVDPDKMVVTPLGVDLETFRPPPARAQGDRPFRVVYVGQITQRKGLSYLIEGFRRAALANAELVFVGSIVGTSAPWQDEPRLRHVPHVPRWELPGIYAQADVFVFPSLVEGFGLTALEAMACGVPVVVSDRTFAGDVITHGRDGLVIPVRNPDAIAETLAGLAADPDGCRAMGEHARRTAEGYSWQAYGDRAASQIAA